MCVLHNMAQLRPNITVVGHVPCRVLHCSHMRGNLCNPVSLLSLLFFSAGRKTGHSRASSSATKSGSRLKVFYCLARWNACTSVFHYAAFGRRFALCRGYAKIST
ncbi:unnamed protein product [Ixodes pacificus]